MNNSLDIVIYSNESSRCVDECFDNFDRVSINYLWRIRQKLLKFGNFRHLSLYGIEYSNNVNVHQCYWTQKNPDPFKFLASWGLLVFHQCHIMLIRKFKWNLIFIWIISTLNPSHLLWINMAISCFSPHRGTIIPNGRRLFKSVWYRRYIYNYLLSFPFYI